MVLTPLIALGFLLGIRHALDADHLVAVSTILTRERSIGRAVSVGVLWGLGHSLTILLVGGVIVALQWAVPPRVELLLELPVALMLIVLGVRSIGASLPPRGHDHGKSSADRHGHVHVHGDYIHSHDHGHGTERHGHDEKDTPVARIDRRLLGACVAENVPCCERASAAQIRPNSRHVEPLCSSNSAESGLAAPRSRGRAFLRRRLLDRGGLYHAIRPVVVGVVHGLAGSAAVALLVLPLVDSTLGGVLYLLLFGAGTILGMTTVTAVIALPLTAGDPIRWIPARMVATWAIGLISIGFGLFLGTRILTSL